jgi:predicted RNA binding protein YcfA (HicA-like mRNA interferase family)
MDKPGSLSGKQLCRILEKDGYVFVRQTGSHQIYQKKSEDGNITIPIPVHSNKPLKKGTFHAILKKAGISKERLSFLLSLLLL